MQFIMDFLNKGKCRCFYPCARKVSCRVPKTRLRELYEVLNDKRQLVFKLLKPVAVTEEEADFAVPVQGDDIADGQRVAGEADAGRAGRCVP